MRKIFFAVAMAALSASAGVAQELPVVEVEAQPLQANLARVVEALEYLGHPLSTETTAAIAERGLTAVELQRVIDSQVAFHVMINPELRVKVRKGPGPTRLQQAGYQPCLIKITNDATIARQLRVASPQSGPVYGGPAVAILKRQSQTELAENENLSREPRFLEIEMFDSPPMTDRLSGLEVEYAIVLIYASESGKREATITFDIGQGTQDLGFRSQVPVLFDIQPAMPVTLRIADDDGSQTTAKLIFRDALGHVYPPQAKRTAPDFFFQPQVYRADGQTILLPPGEFEMTSSRGPEYFERSQKVRVTEDRANIINVQLQRWINPMKFGYYCGDHHIHGAGCSHYDNPTLGVAPADMFAQVKGEGLNVGCVLTWGPCFEYQRNYFSPIADSTSEPMTILKYDLEISGFGSAALGHVCLLNLKNQTYPGSEGSKIKGWPTWTVPVMRWAKEQGGYTGYPHSALHVDPKAATRWSLDMLDEDEDGGLTQEESLGSLLPSAFADIDTDNDGLVSSAELMLANDAAADRLPNLAFPAMDGGGAMEIFVSTAEGVCDFISAMDTARIPEWNTWYHLMNCGFPLKLSGETDFPCMSSRRVGQGRVYVRLAATERLDFTEWCRRLASGQSYVSDGFAHALDFRVNDKQPGDRPVELDQPARVKVTTTVAFAPAQPRAVAYGTLDPSAGPRMAGDTVNLHAPRESGTVEGGRRLVEIVLNGQVVASQVVEADGEIHELAFDIDVAQSSWIAVRQFPQLHTNPVEVIVSGKPIRASRSSAVWCYESVRRLWKNRSRFIAEGERVDARQAYERALATYAAIAAQCPTDGVHIPDTELESK